MDKHKQRLIDSAVKILNDEIDLNMENVRNQSIPLDEMKRTIQEVKHKFVEDLVEPIDYVFKSLLFQPDESIFYIIKYLDTFIAEFDTLYSPSNIQKHWRTINPANYGFHEDNFTYIFDVLYPSGKRVEEFETKGYYNIIIYTIDKFLAPFKFLRPDYAPIISPSPFRRYLKYHRMVIDLAFRNFVNWPGKSDMHYPFIKTYMTEVRDFFVNIQKRSISKDKKEIDEFFKTFKKGGKQTKKRNTK